MLTINATSFRTNLYQELEKANKGIPLRITSKKGDCILISAQDWESLEETLYLMGNTDDWKSITEPVSIKDCKEKLPW